MANFLRQAVSAVRGYTDRAKQSVTEGGSANPIGSELIPMREFRKELTDKMANLHVDAAFARRYLNDGFSGGEKKRAEILQMAMLEPKIAVLDETDSGLDIDALRVVAEGVNSLVGPNMGALLITHYQRLLDYIKPDLVHVFFNGRIVLSGGPRDWRSSSKPRGTIGSSSNSASQCRNRRRRSRSDPGRSVRLVRLANR